MFAESRENPFGKGGPRGAPSRHDSGAQWLFGAFEGDKLPLAPLTPTQWFFGAFEGDKTPLAPLNPRRTSAAAWA